VVVDALVGRRHSRKAIKSEHFASGQELAGERCQKDRTAPSVGPEFHDMAGGQTR
jgi:hypothetical protein